MTEHELATLGALAEALVPADDTPGADAEWAAAFVRRQIERHPDHAARFELAARTLDELAQPTTFATLSVSERSTLLLAHHPTTHDAPEASAAVRGLRHVMRDLIAGFLVADDLDIEDDPFWMRPTAPRRDRSSPSPPEYTATDAIPDLAIDRRMATTTGRGTYARVWRAAGYDQPPGLPSTPEDIRDAPALVRLRHKPTIKGDEESS